jgi:hypothetical protein
MAAVVPYQDTLWVEGGDGVVRASAGKYWWAGFVARERVPGRHESAASAMAAADRHHVVDSS